ncbi:MAG: alpha/beta hydrolase-fold protein [Bernardetiaceae bacterium]|nr:alpha/beta hydrolase-fold protein [Bernardetiaceae bacterium]
MKEEYHKWYSPRIGRDFEMLTFGHGGYPMVIYPTSMGKYYQNKDFGLIHSLEWFINTGRLKVYCPDSLDNDSFYNRGIHPAKKIANHQIYDDLILNEVVYRAMHETGRSTVCVAGCSFGGYHALNFAFRHPDKVKYMFSLGGAFDIRSFMWGYYNDDIYFNNPVDYMPNLGPGWHLDQIRNMGIVLGTGEHDICREDNHRMAGILYNKGINYWLDVRPGGIHDWPEWNRMLPHYVSQMHF